jgi:hypothetical protein
MSQRLCTPKLKFIHRHPIAPGCANALHEVSASVRISLTLELLLCHRVIAIIDFRLLADMNALRLPEHILLHVQIVRDTLGLTVEWPHQIHITRVHTRCEISRDSSRRCITFDKGGGGTTRLVQCVRLWMALMLRKLLLIPAVSSTERVNPCSANAVGR